ncbi:MAG: hypothetical protein J0M37_06365 [Ignavibacteria bacterium]|nr:hypothetical protein [Ignavibacteria bacterium]
MFQDFAKRKFRDYISMLEFPAGRITFERIWNSSLPPFIISFIENYIPKHNLPIEKKEFEELLDKAIVFNINYIIKPKNTLLKFLFGELETRPAAYLLNRTKYFQFYGYYITNIEDFIAVNSLEVVSYNQVAHLLNEVNRSIYEEISGPNSEAHRMNLVKLLYYFFHDLGENNPINIKLPRKILSAYFADKGYTEIKKKIDGFFSDEIFIQEAVELMDPEVKKTQKDTGDNSISDEEIKKIVSKAKTDFINKENADKEIEKILKADEPLEEDITRLNITLIREQEAQLPAAEKNTIIIDDEIYSDDLLFASKFSTIKPPAEPDNKEKRKRLIEDLFCETSYRKKIIRKIFSKDEDEFTEKVNLILNKNNWDEAVTEIEALFSSRKIDFYSDAAVKFVDIFQNHFIKDSSVNGKNKAV